MKAAWLLFLAALLTMSAACAPQLPGLEEYVDVDLRSQQAERREAFETRARVVAGNVKEEAGEESWWVKPVGAGEIAWVWLRAYPGLEVPDVSYLVLRYFDKGWKLRGEQTILTGYRYFLIDVSMMKENPLKADVIVATVTSAGPFLVTPEGKKPAFEQGDFQRQYYAFCGGELALVRMEDDGGKLVRNNYRSRVPWKGPAVPVRSVAEWMRVLEKGTDAEKLAVMVWLSGNHMASAEPRASGVNQESVEDAKVYESVRDSAQTLGILRKLTESKNRWVAEYAKACLAGR